MYLGSIENDVLSFEKDGVVARPGIEIDDLRRCIDLGWKKNPATHGNPPRVHFPVDPEFARDIPHERFESPRAMRADLAENTPQRARNGYSLFDRFEDEETFKQKLVAETNPEDKRAIVFINIPHAGTFNPVGYTTSPCVVRCGGELQEWFGNCRWCHVPLLDEDGKKVHPPDRGECTNHADFPPPGVTVLGWACGSRDSTVYLLLMEPKTEVHALQQYQPLQWAGFIISWDGEQLTVRQGERVKTGETDSPPLVEWTGGDFDYDDYEPPTWEEQEDAALARLERQEEAECSSYGMDDD